MTISVARALNGETTDQGLKLKFAKVSFILFRNEWSDKAQQKISRVANFGMRSFSLPSDFLYVLKSLTVFNA